MNLANKVTKQIDRRKYAVGQCFPTGGTRPLGAREDISGGTQDYLKIYYINVP